MATTRARSYGANISGDRYEAQFQGAEANARLEYTGSTHTKDGQTGPLFRLNADSGGESSGHLQTQIPGTSYTVVFIDTSGGIVGEQEPL